MIDLYVKPALRNIFRYKKHYGINLLWMTLVSLYLLLISYFLFFTFTGFGPWLFLWLMPAFPILLWVGWRSRKHNRSVLLREVATKKALGARSSDIFMQFFAEVFLLNVFADFLALGVLEALLPRFRYWLWIAPQLNFLETIPIIALLCLGLVLSSLLISSFSIISMLAVKPKRGHLSS